jgi:PAT family beta-lactamase induction signal transducer AmpG
MDAPNDSGDALADPWICISAFSSLRLLYLCYCYCGAIWILGFGFAFMMYLIYVADGESKTSHYSIATGFMALGMMLPGMASGFIQEYLLRKLLYLGVSSHYSWILSRFLIFPYDFGKKSETSK